MGAPSVGHEVRRKVLDALAVLAGYTLQLRTGLPDGRQPDVVRLSPRHRSLFIGDAKISEGPFQTWTCVRLCAYLRWFAVEVSRMGSDGVFAVCFASRMDVQGWCETLSRLAREVGSQDAVAESEDLGGGVRCAWIRVGTGTNEETTA